MKKKTHVIIMLVVLIALLSFSPALAEKSYKDTNKYFRNVTITVNTGDHIEGYLNSEGEVSIQHYVGFYADSDIYKIPEGNEYYVVANSTIVLTDAIERVSAASELYRDGKLINIAVDTQFNANGATAINDAVIWISGSEYRVEGTYTMLHDGVIGTAYSYDTL